MDSLHAGALSMSGGPALGKWLSSRWGLIWLATARIDGQLDVNDSIVTGDLKMNDVAVGTKLFLLKSTLTKVILSGAKIGGMLQIQGPRRREDPLTHKYGCDIDMRPRPNLPLSQSTSLEPQWEH